MSFVCKLNFICTLINYLFTYFGEMFSEFQVYFVPGTYFLIEKKKILIFININVSH